MLLPILHYLHIFVAAAWAGGTLLAGLVLFPMIARQPADRAAELFEALRRPIAAGLGSAAGITYLLGLARAWAGGGVQTLADFATPYAMLVLSAVVIMMLIEHLGGRLRRQLPPLMTEPEQFADQAPALARRTGLLQLVLLAVLVAIMAVMGLGYV